MTYLIKEIIDQKIWDDFVDSQKPSSFLHSYAWGEVEKDTGRKVMYLGVYEGSRLIGATLATIVHARRGNMIVVPHGPIIERSLEKNSDALKNILQAIRDELVRIGKKEGCVVIRVCPLLPNEEENRQVFASLGFRSAPIHVYTELSWILDIAPTEDVLLSGMKKNTRYGIKKASRDGITITSSNNPNDIELFWKLYSETAERHAFVPYTKKMIAAEFTRFSTLDRARWYFAHHEGTIISTALIVYNSHSAFYHHGASTAHSSITPGELMQWQIILDAKARGPQTYNFWGVVPDDKTNHPWFGLSKFKKGFGGYAEEYVHAQDYPLSWKYGITYMIETIRRLKRHV